MASSSEESRSVSSPSRCGSLASLASFWIRLASSKADRQSPERLPQPPDVLGRVALAAGQLAEEQPDQDHDRDHDRRDHEELDHESGGGGLDRGQVGKRRGVRWDRSAIGAVLGVRVLHCARALVRRTIRRAHSAEGMAKTILLFSVGIADSRVKRCGSMPDYRSGTRTRVPLDGGAGRSGPRRVLPVR